MIGICTDSHSQLPDDLGTALCHPTMLRNLVNQLRMQAGTGGWKVPMIDDALGSGDLSPLFDPLLRRQAQLTGRRHGLTMAVEFRAVRFGGPVALLDQFGVRHGAPRRRKN